MRASVAVGVTDDLTGSRNAVDLVRRAHREIPKHLRGPALVVPTDVADRAAVSAVPS